MDDMQIKAEARRWRAVILRGDCTKEYAIVECTGRITYPYADTATYERIKGVVAEVLEVL